MPTKFIKEVFLVLIALLILYGTYLLILLSLPYLELRPGIEFLKSKQLIYHIKHWRWSFYVHVFSSSFIVLAGLFQFNKYMIQKQKKTHHFFGYVYFTLVLLISGPAAFIMSLYANGGLCAQISFVTLSFLWLFSTMMALIKVKKGEYEAHGKWLLRSYALTLSAITLRFYSYMISYFRIDIGPVETYILISYLSWIPNLIFAEIMIKKGFIKRLISSY